MVGAPRVGQRCLELTRDLSLSYDEGLQPHGYPEEVPGGLFAEQELDVWHGTSSG